MNKALAMIAVMLLALPVAYAAGPFFQIKGLHSVENGGFLGFPYTGAPVAADGSSIVVEGAYARFNVIVKNTGDAEDALSIEGGIYKREMVNQWYGGNVFSVISQVANCVSNEPHVQTKLVKLAAGEEAMVPITVTVPRPGGYPNSQFGFHAQAFRNCWEAGVDTGRDSYSVHKLTIADAPIVRPSEASCSDGILNQDETSKDCGGDTCGPCGEAAVCIGDNDCATGLICELSGSQKKCVAGSRPVTPSVPSPLPVPATCGNGQLDAGESCLNCKEDSDNCADEPTSLPWSAIFIVIGIGIIGYYVVRRFL